MQLAGHGWQKKEFHCDSNVKTPALALLANLGLTYLSGAEALQLRGSKERLDGMVEL